MTKLTKRGFLAGSTAAGAMIAMPSVLRAQATVIRWADGQPQAHPSPQSAVKVWTTLDIGLRAMGQLGRGEISAKVLLRKARVRLGWA